MRTSIVILIFLLFSTNLLSQNVWNKVWTMQQMPFQVEDISSEVSKVIAGFDTDGDGWGEFICGTGELEKNYIYMYEATGDNTYELVWYYEIPISGPSGNGWFGIAVGDIDNNGIVEILLGWPSDVNVQSNPSRIFTFEWNGTTGENKYGRDQNDGTFNPTHQTNFGLDANIQWDPYSMIVEDVDKDGENELVLGILGKSGNGGRGREVLIASVTGGDLSGFGRFEVEYNFQNNEGGSNFCTAIGDLDNDGNTDIFEMVWNMFTLRIFEATGPDTYEHVNDIEQLYGDQGIDYGALDGLKIADINGDGKNELFIAGTEPENIIFIIQNISDISLITESDIIEFYHIPSKVKPDGSSTFGQFRNMVIGDPDHDGKLSLMIAGEKNGQIFDLEYKGSGELADASNWELTIAYDVFEDAAADVGDSLASELSPRMYYGSIADDMDQDGLSEYVFVNYSTDKFAWASDPYVTIIEADAATGINLRNSFIPETFILNQNYPNPFNPITTISFSLPEKENVFLEVYNMLGEVVKTLLNKQLAAGNYNFEFNASNLSSGTYLYRISAGENVKVRKMIILK